MLLLLTIISCKKDNAKTSIQSSIEKKYNCKIIKKNGETILANGELSPYLNLILTGLDTLTKNEAIKIITDAALLYFKDNEATEKDFKELVVSIPYRNYNAIDTVSSVFTATQLNQAYINYKPLAQGLEGLKYKNYSVLLGSLHDNFKAQKQTGSDYENYLKLYNQKYGAVTGYSITKMLKKKIANDSVIEYYGELKRGTKLKQNFVTAAFFKEERPRYHLLKLEKVESIN